MQSSPVAASSGAISLPVVAPSPVPEFTHFVGVEIAARTFVANHVTPDDQTERTALSLKQNAEGIAHFERYLHDLSPDIERVHVSMEITGNYHEKLAHALYERQIAVSLLNPVPVKRFSEVFLQRDKSDKLDAWTIARFGAQIRPRCWTPPPALYTELSQRIWQRTSLVKMHAETVNRAKSSAYRQTYSPAVAARDKELSLFLKRQIKGVERECEQLLATEPTWAAAAERMTTIPGVGIVTAIWLLTLTCNFTNCSSPKQLAAFLGVVPRRRQSGTSLNTYTSVGYVGHDDVRQHLYIATMSCLRYNPVIRTYYDNLKAHRTSHKLACVASTRKLLHIIWSIATRETTFDPEYEKKRAELRATAKLRSL